MLKADTAFFTISRHLSLFAYYLAQSVTRIRDLPRDLVPFTCTTSQLVLTISDPERETELHTDARAVGYGVVALQKVNGKRHAVAY